MKGYVYFLINTVNNKRYVGITTNYSSRISHHLCALEANRHSNLKLQNAWNYYGKENFKIEKVVFDNISRKDLRDQERFYIQKYDSYNCGYNCTLGGEEGEGNNSRGKMSYEDYCFAYIGNIHFQGMTSRTAKFLGCDSSIISSIKNEKSYLWFLEALQKESVEFKKEILNKFIEEMDLKNKPPIIMSKTPDEEITFQILCFVSTYGRGAEQICLNKFNLSKGFVRHFCIGKGRINIKERYKNSSQEEIQRIGRQCYYDWGITKILKEEFTDLSKKYNGYNF